MGRAAHLRALQQRILQPALLLVVVVGEAQQAVGGLGVGGARFEPRELPGRGHTTVSSAWEWVGGHTT